MNRLNGFDKNVLLLVFGLTIFVIFGATLLEVFGFITKDTAWIIDLAAVAWWFGAIMTFTYERIKGRLAQR